MTRSNGPVTPGSQHIIRIALLGGVAVFGAVAIYLAKNGAVQPANPETIEALEYAYAAMLFVVAGSTYLLRRRRTTATDAARILQLNIVGWALGESLALLGGVMLLLSGDVVYYLVGVVMMLVSFVFFPIPPE